MCCACTHHTVCYRCSVSLLSPVLSRFTRLARTRIVACLRACLPACLCVFMSCSCTTTNTTSTTTTSLSPPPSEGYEKSRSLNNIAGMTGMAGNALRLSPVTSPYGSPCPLRRSRSPIPSILWDVQPWATFGLTHLTFYPQTSHLPLVLYLNSVLDIVSSG